MNLSHFFLWLIIQGSIWKAHLHESSLVDSNRNFSQAFSVNQFWLLIASFFFLLGHLWFKTTTSDRCQGQPAFSTFSLLAFLVCVFVCLCNCVIVSLCNCVLVVNLRSKPSHRIDVKGNLHFRRPVDLFGLLSQCLVGRLSILIYHSAQDTRVTTSLGAGQLCLCVFAPLCLCVFVSLCNCVFV